MERAAERIPKSGLKGNKEATIFMSQTPGSQPGVARWLKEFCYSFLFFVIVM